MKLHNELMLDNYVLCTYFDDNGNLKECIGQVCCIDRDEEITECNLLVDTCLDKDYDQIKGIEITEGWIKDLGINFFGKSYSRLNLFKHEKLDFAIAQTMDNKWQPSWNGTILKNIPFQFVHHIQNLFFCLTGEKLKA